MQTLDQGGVRCEDRRRRYAGGLTLPPVIDDDARADTRSDHGGIAVEQAHVPPAVPIDEGALRDIAVLFEAGAVMALTGAGMSTASGIPDYRGPDGTRRVRPMQYADFLASSVNRRRYWARSYAGWAAFSSARPNRAHRALARLESNGSVHGVITQNVDGLHQQAGSAAVIELHGNLARVICLDCGAHEDRWSVQNRLARANPTLASAHLRIRPDGDVDLAPEQAEAFTGPRCLDCGGDTVKPDVVFFGGGVSREVVDQAYAWVDRCDALVVLGSSLQVMSGLRFVRHASRRGIPVAAITRGPVRGADLVDIHVDALLADSLASLADRSVSGGSGVDA